MKIQLMELQVIVILLFVPMVFLIVTIGDLVILSVICFLLFLVNVIYPIAVMLWSEKKYGKGIIYIRQFDVIEFHLTRTRNWWHFAKRVSKVRKIARELNVSILFYTDHYS